MIFASSSDGTTSPLGRTAQRCAVGVALALGTGIALPAVQAPPPSRQAPPQPPTREAPAQQPTFRTRATIVRVDVSVVGRRDEIVGDLQASDFTVHEDGVPQRIDAFQFIRLDGHPDRDADEALAIRSQDHAEAEATRPDVRVFAIFFDEYHVAPRAPQITIPMREALIAFVEALGPTDLVALVDPLTPLSALRFTRSTFDIVEKIRVLRGRQGELVPVRSIVEEEQLSTRDPFRLRSEVTLSALASLVTYLGSLHEGRKSVVFVSHGPPVSFRGGDSLRNLLREVLTAANRGNVTINVLDPRGLTSTRGADVLYELASETGGRRILSTNDLKGGLAGVIRDASAYYVLGYTPSRDIADGKFRRIEVKTLRKGVRVVARRGYWAPKPEEIARAAAAAQAPVVPGVREAMAELSESKSGRSADVWVGVARGSDGTTRLLLAWEPAGRAGGGRPAVVSAEPLDADGAAHQAPSLSAILPGTLASLDVPAGRLTLRFTARDSQADTVDSWKHTLDVPDFEREALALSTPRLLLARSPAEVRALEKVGGLPPTASRRFRRSDRLVFEVDRYAPDEATPVTAHLLNAAGAPLRALPLSVSIEGLARFELPLGYLAVGSYLVRVQAQRGIESVEHLVAFRVVP